MENILEPVTREKLIKDLNHCKLIRNTLRKNNEVYSFTFQEAPSLMIEVARLREKAYRSIGCGSGKSVDIDQFDKGPDAYRQLIVWNPKDREIIGGYRYAIGKNYLQQTHQLSMSHYFRFSKKFVSEYLPQSIELGRAWVNPLYQPSANESRSIFALDNLWEGIGAVIAENKEVQFLYGKVTIPESYHQIARILLTWFMNHYLRDTDHLLFPRTPVDSPTVLSIGGIEIVGSNPEQDFRIISNYIKSLGTVVPPLINAYMKLASKIVAFGTAVNPELDHAFETGILIDVKDIFPEKYSRYVQTEIFQIRGSKSA